MMKRMGTVLIALAMATSILAPSATLAITRNTFYGIVEHVSVNNIKVMDTQNHQILSFEIVPKFDQVLSADGKTTYQMKDIKVGHYVAIIYDQKALGVRHADKIYILTNANQKIRTE
jgi:hypothetical protein